jgi:hypothetical protein
VFLAESGAGKVQEWLDRQVGNTGMSLYTVVQTSAADPDGRNLQVSEYYDAALTAAAEGPNPTAHYFPAVSTAARPSRIFCSRLTLHSDLDVTRHGQALSFRSGCTIPAQYG